MTTLYNHLISELYAFSTPAVSDALDACEINGVLRNLTPMGSSQKLIGPAYTVQYKSYEKTPEQFMQASNYIDEVPEGAVIFIDNGGLLSCSVWGGILTHYAYHKKIAGTIVNGLVRDIDILQKYDYPLFARGAIPRSGKNRVYAFAQCKTIIMDEVRIHFNDIIFADSNGVLVIPENQLQKIVEMVKNIAQTEKRIIEAIDSGKSLKEARSLYHYHTPWSKD